MKKALKPSLEITDKELFSRSNNVVNSLLDNPYFPNPTPSIPVAQAACQTYSDSLALSFAGSMQQKAQKDADKQVLLSIIRELCDYVNAEAKGDFMKLATCGFQLSKDREPVKLGTARPKIIIGNVSGQVTSITPRVTGAVTYRHQYTTDPSDEVWQEVSSTRAKCILKNLVPGQVYRFRIIAIGTSNQVTTSAIITRMVA